MLTPSGAHDTPPTPPPPAAAGRRGAPDRLGYSGHSGRCRCCGRPVVFRETLAGRWQPWDVDPGTGEVTAVHFGTCPARRQAKREQRVREGKPPDVPLDRCHLPACGSSDLVSLAPTGEGRPRAPLGVPVPGLRGPPVPARGLRAPGRGPPCRGHPRGGPTRDAPGAPAVAPSRVGLAVGLPRRPGLGLVAEAAGRPAGAAGPVPGRVLGGGDGVTPPPPGRPRPLPPPTPPAPPAPRRPPRPTPPGSRRPPACWRSRRPAGWSSCGALGVRERPNAVADHRERLLRRSGPVGARRGAGCPQGARGCTSPSTRSTRRSWPGGPTAAPASARARGRRTPTSGAGAGSRSTSTPSGPGASAPPRGSGRRRPRGRRRRRPSSPAWGSPTPCWPTAATARTCSTPSTSRPRTGGSSGAACRPSPCASTTRPWWSTRPTTTRPGSGRPSAPWPGRASTCRTRPHRLAVLLSAPASAGAGAARGPGAPGRRRPEAGARPCPGPPAAGAAIDPEAFIRRGEAERGWRGRWGPWQAGRKYVFDVCPFVPDHTDRAAYFLVFPSGALDFGCHHNGCQGKGWPELKALLAPPPEAAPAGAGGRGPAPDRASLTTGRAAAGARGRPRAAARPPAAGARAAGLEPWGEPVPLEAGPRGGRPPRLAGRRPPRGAAGLRRGGRRDLPGAARPGRAEPAGGAGDRRPAQGAGGAPAGLDGAAGPVGLPHRGERLPAQRRPGPGGGPPAALRDGAPGARAGWTRTPARARCGWRRTTCSGPSGTSPGRPRPWPRPRATPASRRPSGRPCSKALDGQQQRVTQRLQDVRAAEAALVKPPGC